MESRKKDCTVRSSIQSFHRSQSIFESIEKWTGTKDFEATNNQRDQPYRGGNGIIEEGNVKIPIFDGASNINRKAASLSQVPAIWHQRAAGSFKSNVWKRRNIPPKRVVHERSPWRPILASAQQASQFLWVHLEIIIAFQAKWSPWYIRRNVGTGGCSRESGSHPVSRHTYTCLSMCQPLLIHGPPRRYDRLRWL